MNYFRSVHVFTQQKIVKKTSKLKYFTGHIRFLLLVTLAIVKSLPPRDGALLTITTTGKSAQVLKSAV